MWTWAAVSALGFFFGYQSGTVRGGSGEEEVGEDGEEEEDEEEEEEAEEEEEEGVDEGGAEEVRDEAEAEAEAKEVEVEEEAEAEDDERPQPAAARSLPYADTARIRSSSPTPSCCCHCCCCGGFDDTVPEALLGRRFLCGGSASILSASAPLGLPRRTSASDLHASELARTTSCGGGGGGGGGALSVEVPEVEVSAPLTHRRRGAASPVAAARTDSAVLPMLCFLAPRGRRHPPPPGASADTPAVAANDMASPRRRVHADGQRVTMTWIVRVRGNNHPPYR